jgi:hypothetical protein
MTWARQVASMGGRGGEFWYGNQKERENQEDLDTDGRIILKCILEKQNEEWPGFIRLRIGASGGLL